MSPELVGRDAEIAQIRYLTRAVRQGRTQLLLLTGEPGIGKSALAAEATRGLSTTRVHHRESDAQVPLGAARQVVRFAGRDVAEPDTQSSPIDLAVQIAALWETAGHPSAVVVEDVHWIDRASQEVLWHVVNRLDDIGCLLVFTSRHEHDWFSERLAAHLAVGDVGRHIALGPLSPSGVREFVRHELQLPLTKDQLGKIMTASGGSPLYLEALLGQLEQSRLGTDSLAGAISALSANWAEGGLGDIIRQELTRLSADETAVLLAIALGGPLTDQQLTGVCQELGLGTVDIWNLRSSSLMSTGTPFTFRHQSLAEGFARQLPADRRRATHRALSRITTGLESLRHRVAAADDGQDAELLNDLIMALIVTGEARDLETAHLLASWSARVDPNMLPTACLMTFRARRPSLLLGHEDEIRAMLPSPMRQLLIGGLEVVATAHESTELADPKLLAASDETMLLLFGHIYADLGRLRAAAANFAMPRMLNLVREAIDRHIADSGLGPDRLEEFNALSAILRIWSVFGAHGDEPRRAIAEFAALADELREVPGAAQVATRGIQIAASLSSYLSSNVEAREFLDELLERDPAAAHDLSVAAIRFRLNFVGGRWDAAQLANEPALAHALDAMGEVDTLRAQALSAVVPLCRGEIVLGERIIARVQRQESSGFSASTGTANWGLGWVGAINGDSRMVVNNLDPFWSQQVTAIFSGVASGLLRARAHAELGDLSAARSALRVLLGMPLDDQAREYFRLHGDAVLAAADGRAADADALFRSAIPALEQLISGTPLGWILFRSLLAEDHARLLIGRPELILPGDEEPLEEAISLALQLGAKPWRARLEELRDSWPDTAARPEPAPVAPSAESELRHFASLDQLTSREREITLLLLSGLGNREIADKLFLSVRTVEFHVRNSLQKLGVASRVELRNTLGSHAGR